ncbi:hypothetical protein [Salibacterium halotolerans]|uniref:Uncharacterized protein n=1 Tax=Salibacterium halotolerans TaxID=1884432 RepID=A0A1I5PDH9_9BACI|nr:hypothetical protein [Salibacterium halotolerans]SFP32144.1 hypothetical protein SAMN05518683_10483 [Salibacterium halotolerans]
MPWARLAVAAAVLPDQLLVETDGLRPFQDPFAGIEITPELLGDVITTPAGITKEKGAALVVQLQKNEGACLLRSGWVDGPSLGMGPKAL